MNNEQNNTSTVPAPPDTEPSPSQLQREKLKQRRGFAAMDPDKRREISSKGGIAAHKLGRAHQFTEEEARFAGRKGGRAPHAKRGRQIVSE